MCVRARTLKQKHTYPMSDDERRQFEALVGK